MYVKGREEVFRFGVFRRYGRRLEECSGEEEKFWIEIGDRIVFGIFSSFVGREY